MNNTDQTIKDMVILNDLDKSVKGWYTKAYESDELGANIIESTTFFGIYVNLLGRNRKSDDLDEYDLDVYDLLGVGDSLVRERVFDELAIRLNVSGESIYELWLNS